MAPPRPTPRDVDRLRTLSPLSRNLGMSSLRGATTLTQRGSALTNGSLSKRSQPLTKQGNSCSQSSNSCSTNTPTRGVSLIRTIRTTPVRNTRANIAATCSPRKGSAPGRLLSGLGGSLDSLPDTVTLRRKVSTPARSGNHVITRINHHTNNQQLKKPILGSKTYQIKKTSAPDRLISTENSIFGGISKDHGSSGSGSQQQNTNNGAGAKSFNSLGSASGDGKSSKKGFTTYSIPEVQILPTLKEEKKSKAKSRKMSENIPPSNVDRSAASATVPSAAEATSECTSDVPPTKRASLDFEAKPPQQSDELKGLSGNQIKPSHQFNGTPDLPQNDAVEEKSKLERMVSDLIKNNECKKQELAALKMEINRLKEIVRDRHQSELSKKESSNAPSGSKTFPAEYMETESKMANENELSKLESLVDSLSTENRLLRDHLQQMGFSLDSSPLSDHQKEMILSRVTLSQSGGENLSCGGERDWDNKSSSSISEISVACLQGRIQQMEETHYSTNEELQATLQELDDLREQFSECQIEMQQLQEEKQVILESLTQQTEKLNEARSYNDTLKIMLIQQSENSQDVSQCERTQRLMELLKSVQEDKELVQIKQEEFDQQLQSSKEVEEHFHNEAQLIRDRMKLLESMVESATHDKKNVENQLLEAQDFIKATERDNDRLKASLAVAKDKITELEAAVISGEKSELADVLERVSSEKEVLEKEIASLHKKVNNLVCENEKFKDQVADLQDNLRVTRNNAKTNLDDVEWRRTQLNEKRRELEQEVESLKIALSDAQMTCQRHLEDKRELKANLSDSQKKLAEMLERQAEIERGFSDERVVFTRQVEEWEQFQKDLLTSVRVANDFKTEAQHNLERFQQENNMLKERLRQLDVDLERARVTSKLSSPANSISSINSLTSSGSIGSYPADRRMYRSVSHMTNGESILNDRRNNPRPLARGDSRVKSLIESIECATKQTKAGSRSSSTSSLASTGSETNNNNVKSQLLKRAETDSIIRNLPSSLSSMSPLKDSMNTSPSPLRAINCNSMTDSHSPLSNKTSTQLTNLPDTVKMSQLTNDKNNSIYSNNSYSSSTVSGTVDGVNKSVSILNNKIEPIRKNSYGQMSMGDKKDPLAALAQNGGSKRNALLKWCQNKTIDYPNVDITNFSSSWNDGLAFCAILDSYLPEKIDYRSLNPSDKRRNFEIAFDAAESVGIPTILDIGDMIASERPSWQLVFNYVTSIYGHFET